MFRFRFSLLRALALASLLWNASLPAQSQTLTDVVQQAMSSYPSLASALAKAQAARADIARARSAHYPQISVGASANSYASGSVPASVGSTTFSPTARLNLWSGGRIEADAQRSEALTQASEAQRLVTLEDVALQATEAYLNWSKTAELYQLGVRNLNSHLETLDDIRKISAADTGRRIDLEQAQVRVDNARLSMQQRKSDLVLAMQRLQRFWPREMDARPVGLDQSLGPGGPLGSLPMSVEEATAQLNEKMPVLAQLRAQVDATRAAVRQARGLHWPTVDVVSSRQYNINTQRFDTLTQLQLNMPVYNGRNADAQVEAALAQQAAAEAALEEGRLLQREKIAAAWQEWAAATSRSRLGASQSDVGDKVVEGYRQQFRLARRSLLDLLNIQADAYNYRSAALAAVHDERIARARLLAAMGALATRFEPGSVLQTGAPSQGSGPGSAPTNVPSNAPA